MRLTVKTYADGKRYLAETNNDATEVIKEDGKSQPGKRISAILEVLADDSASGMDRVLEMLQVIEAEIRRRKQALGKVEDKSRGRLSRTPA